MKEWNFERCVSILSGEIELLKKIFAAQETVRRAVINREWAEFEEITVEVNRMGAEFALLEDERVLLFSALKNNLPAAGETREKSFYALILQLPPEERRELSRLHGKLKMETLKMRAQNETFFMYINEARTIAASYLETICPARGGKLYTRKGRRVSQDLRSIVINNRF